VNGGKKKLQAGVGIISLPVRKRTAKFSTFRWTVSLLLQAAIDI
jgi:hypothetical protein